MKKQMSGANQKGIRLNSTCQQFYQTLPSKPLSQPQYNDDHILHLQSQNNSPNKQELLVGQQLNANDSTRKYRSKIKTKKSSNILKKQHYEFQEPSRIQQKHNKQNLIQKTSNSLETNNEVFDLLDRYRQQNREHCAVRAYNYLGSKNVINKKLRGLGIIDSPETVNYIIQAMQQLKKGSSEKSQKINFLKCMTARDTPKFQKSSENHQNIASQKISPRSNKKARQKQINMQQLLSNKSTETYNLQKLDRWLKEKLTGREKINQNNEAIVNRLHTLHLGFSQAFREVSKFSNQLSQILVLIHSQYHSLYDNLVHALMKHNKQLKKQLQNSQDSLNWTISHYQKQLLDIRVDFDKKSAKVIQNFHKCINLKIGFEQDSKTYAKALKQEKSKMKYMEECLTKAIHILVQIGNQRFNFLTPQQQEAINQLSGTFKLCPEDCKLFYQWCATVVRNLTVMRQSKSSVIKPMEKAINDYALSTIGKFMIDTDSNLSIQQVKQILNSYVPHYTPNIIRITAQSAQEIQGVEEQKHKYDKVVPDLYEIRDKLNGKSAEVQVNCNWDYQSKAIQSTPEMVQAYVIAKPSLKQKQTCTIVWIRQKMKLCSNQINTYIWAQRQVKQIKVTESIVKKSERRGSIRNELVKVQMMAPKTQKISVSKKIVQVGVQTDPEVYENQSDNEQKMSKTKLSILPLAESHRNTQNQSVRNSLQPFEFELKLTSKRKRRKSRKVGFNSNEIVKQCLNINNFQPEILKSEEQVAIQKQKNRSKSVRHFNENGIQKIQEEQEENDKVITISKLKNMNHRKGILAKNLEKFVDDIVDMRSMKNLKVKPPQPKMLSFHSSTSQKKQGNVEQNRPKEIRDSVSLKKNDKILLSLIKVPRKLLLSAKYQEYAGNVHNFRLEVIEKVQDRNRVITQSTMWTHKRSLEIQKICLKIQGIRERSSINGSYGISNQYSKIEGLKYLFRIEINPILTFYLKLYKQLAQAQKNLSSPEFRRHLYLAKKIPYYHRLAPLLYSLINMISTNFNLKNANSLSLTSNKYYYKELTKIYTEIKSLRHSEKQPIIQIYEQLLDGRQIQLDVFIKIITHLEQKNNRTSLVKNQDKEHIGLMSLQETSIFINVAEVQLFLILDDYLSLTEINALIGQIRTLKRQKQRNRRSESQSDNSIKFDEKIPLVKVMLKIFKALKNKKSILRKRYKGVMELIGLQNENQAIQINDLLYLLEVLPIDRNSKNKLIYQSSFYSVYWSKKHASIPYDRVLFMFDSIKFLQKVPDFTVKKNSSGNDNLSSAILMQYYQLKIQEDPSLKNIYSNLLHNSDFIAQSIYKVLFRVPRVIYKLTEELKAHGSIKQAGKRSSIMLVILYRTIILQEIQKIYFAGTLNLIESLSFLTTS